MKDISPETEKFAGQVVSDIAAAFSGVMSNIGNKLGLYKSMAYGGELTSQAVAKQTGLHERYVREWLNNQVAGGYIHFIKENNTYLLPDDHIPILVDEDSPLFMLPALEVAASLWLDEEKIIDLFRTGEGMEWGSHNHRLFCGTEALFQPGYKTFLVEDWLNAVEGLNEKLEKGAKVADIGCGHGASTILMAKAFPQSQFYGYDFHKGSINVAETRAKEAGAKDNVKFEVASAKSYEKENFDLICFMDCLHDMGDPVGAARHARESLKPDGIVLLAEPAAGDSLIENINPVGRLYYAASTGICTPCSLSQEGKAGLGAQAGQQRLSEIMEEAGFSHIEKVAQTPFNIILAAHN